MNKLQITLLGIGGSGCNMINYVYNDFKNNKNIKLISANTDIQSLNTNKSTHKIVLGNNGLGAGMKPEIGKHSAEVSKNEIIKHLENTDLLIVVTGLGGGTGSGATPVIVKYAKELGIQTIGLVTLPFQFEGNKRKKIALNALKKLENLFNSFIVIDNNNIFKIVSRKMGYKEALNEVNKILKKTLKAIVNIVFDYNVNDINVDFNDLRTVLNHPGKGIFTYSQGKSAKEAIINALNNQLFEYSELKEVSGILVNFKLNENYPLVEIEEAMNYLYEHTNEDTDIIFGTYTDNNIKNVEVAMIITGIENNKKKKEKNKETNIMKYFKNFGVERLEEIQEEMLEIPSYMRIQINQQT